MGFINKVMNGRASAFLLLRKLTLTDKIIDLKLKDVEMNLRLGNVKGNV